jgi:hypothetical protein
MLLVYESQEDQTDDKKGQNEEHELVYHVIYQQIGTFIFSISRDVSPLSVRES